MQRCSALGSVVSLCLLLRLIMSRNRCRRFSFHHNHLSCYSVMRKRNAFEPAEKQKRRLKYSVIKEDVDKRMQTREVCRSIKWWFTSSQKYICIRSNGG
jgi:hypothetical protein